LLQSPYRKYTQARKEEEEKKGGNKELPGTIREKKQTKKKLVTKQLSTNP